MAGCTVNQTASPHFDSLCRQWKRTYGNIHNDLDKAFKDIAQDILAHKGSRVQAGPNVEVWKHRQNSSDIKRGQSYGWRIISLLDKKTHTLYPIVVYPKPVWENADDATISEAVKEIRIKLGYCIADGCVGTMQAIEQHQDRTQCNTCGAIQYVLA